MFRSPAFSLSISPQKTIDLSRHPILLLCLVSKASGSISCYLGLGPSIGQIAGPGRLRGIPRTISPYHPLPEPAFRGSEI